MPALSPDDQLLLAALEAGGARVRVAQWRGPVLEDAVAVVRSCWDYAADPVGFLDACAGWSAAGRLLNPLETIRWNLDKRYLGELAAAGVEMPETVHVAADAPRSLADVIADLGGGEVVVKPCVGASGIGAWRSADPGDPRWHEGAGVDRLVQRFVPGVVEDGELSLTWFRDGYSHAVRKRVRAGEFRVQEEHGGTVEIAHPDRGIVVAAERVLAAVSHDWWYARVDGVVERGRFLLMELELVEPELFFRWGEGSAARLARLLRTVA